jgi:Domain of unknown function (DUF1929)
MPNVDTACTNPFNTNIERFTPPYLETAQKSGRPVIQSAPTEVTHYSSFKIGTSSPSSIARVTFVRQSSTTHSTNTDQRFVELQILAKDSSNVYVRAPPPNVGVAGNYYLFLLDAAGTPSIASTVNLQLGPSVNITLPGSDGKSPAATMSTLLGLFLAPVMMFV